MRLIFIVPPGVGKGTQAKLIKKYLGIVHLSTGDILRAEIAQATPLGIKAKSYIDKGHLVPDNELLNIMSKRLNEDDAKKLEEKLKNATFDLDDFRKQLKQIKSMGSLNQIMSMMPGMNRKLMKGMDFDDKKIIWTDAIISSMTFEERKNPSIIDGSRRSRISKGSGRTVQEINQLLKQFTEMKKMMKKMGKMKMPKNLKNQMMGIN